MALRDDAKHIALSVRPDRFHVERCLVAYGGSNPQSFALLRGASDGNLGGRRMSKQVPRELSGRSASKRVEEARCSFSRALCC